MPDEIVLHRTTVDATPERDPQAPDARREGRNQTAKQSALESKRIEGSRPGNVMYAPPPPALLPDLLSAFEKYIHHTAGLPPLVRVGLLHVQFETIHPYLHGNGRFGRLLVTHLLEHWMLLTKPLLHLSMFLKRSRTEYYLLLTTVRKAGRMGILARLLYRRCGLDCGRSHNHCARPVCAGCR